MNPVIQARTIYFPAELHSSFPASRHTASSKTQSAAMAHPLPRFLSRRLWQQSSAFSWSSNPLRENFQVQIRNSITRRSYATGESGPNPRPGQSPFKIWPFIAIAVAGSGAYVLMVRSRLGMGQSLFSIPYYSVESFDSRAGSYCQHFKTLYSTLFLLYLQLLYCRRLLF